MITIKITKKNINKILEDNKYFNGMNIKEINYNIQKNSIIIKLDNIKLKFINIKECNIKEYFDWEMIDKCFLEFVKLEEMELICFATSEVNPYIYIVSDYIEYSK